MPRVFPNPHYRHDFLVEAPSQAPLEVHRCLPGYAPTPLHHLPALATRIGLGSIWVKDESSRLGLPAYKVLGAVWAATRELGRRSGHPYSGGPLDQWRRHLESLGAVRLVTATDGNHGRGVARVARWLGLGAEIYLPLGSAAARVAAIRSEGAKVVEVPGTYDHAVEQAAAAARSPDVILIQDHGWPGYEQIPTWVAEGYETLLSEIDQQLDPAEPLPDLVLVQIGVGTLAGAVVSHYRNRALMHRPVLIGVEPTGAACALCSAEAGRPVMIQAGVDASIMAGLNCGTPSSAAWPLLRDGIRGFVAVADDQAREAMRLLAGVGVVAGESGAAGLAGLIELMRPAHEGFRREIGLDSRANILLIVTEGATDPESYRLIVGVPPEKVSR